MNRKVLLLAGAIGALFAGKSATTSAPQGVATGSDIVDIEPIGGSITICPDYAVSKKPAPAEPVAQRTVELQNPPTFPGISRQIIERPMRRKVKYGKSRWVMLG